MDDQLINPSRTIFPPTEDDLSHTGGECEAVDIHALKEIIPTDEQHNPKEIYEPGQAPKWGVTKHNNNAAASTEQAHQDPSEDEAVR